jgi:hypothetical protein
MKVHVTLSQAVRNDPEAKKVALDRVAEIGIRNVNLKRSDRYGIITGDIDPEKLSELRKLEQVKAVEVDGLKFSNDAD